MLSSPMSDITDIIDAFIASHGEFFKQKEGGRPWPPAGPLLCSARWTGPWGRHQHHAMMLRRHRQHHGPGRRRRFCLRHRPCIHLSLSARAYLSAALRPPAAARCRCVRPGAGLCGCLPAFWAASKNARRPDVDGMQHWAATGRCEWSGWERGGERREVDGSNAPDPCAGMTRMHWSFGDRTVGTEPEVKATLH